jgi:type I restriction enzyme M protein
MTDATDAIRRLWGLCSILRDEGVTYHEYLTELTYLLFLKLADELGIEDRIPSDYRWSALLETDRTEVLDRYQRALNGLGDSEDPILQAIFANARTRIRTDEALSMLLAGFSEIDWYRARQNGLGDIYEGLIQKSAQESRYGAGQYFTPRAVIEAIVAALRPSVEDSIYDPAAGTGGFLVAAGLFVRETLSKGSNVEQPRLIAEQPRLIGIELVSDVHRLALMNLLLHDLEAELLLGDALKNDFELPPSSVCMTNPPFGIKGSIPAEDSTELDFPTSNKQLAFLQHVYMHLAPNGRAAVVVPDNVLFETGVARAIRTHIMEQFELHTVLRLPTGIFYATGIKTSVLFFNSSDRPEGATKETWFYDLRNSSSFSRKKQLSHEDLTDFLEHYGDDPWGRSHRQESKRFRRVAREEVRQVEDRLDLGLASPTGGAEVGTSPAALIELIATELSAAGTALRALGELIQAHGLQQQDMNADDARG